MLQEDRGCKIAVNLSISWQLEDLLGSSLSLVNTLAKILKLVFFIRLKRFSLCQYVLFTSIMSVNICALTNVCICEENPVFAQFSVFGEKWLSWTYTVESRDVVKVVRHK